MVQRNEISQSLTQSNKFYATTAEPPWNDHGYRFILRIFARKLKGKSQERNRPIVSTIRYYALSHAIIVKCFQREVENECFWCKKFLFVIIRLLSTSYLSKNTNKNGRSQLSRKILDPEKRAFRLRIFFQRRGPNSYLWKKICEVILWIYTCEICFKIFLLNENFLKYLTRFFRFDKTIIIKDRLNLHIYTRCRGTHK